MLPKNFCVTLHKMSKKGYQNFTSLFSLRSYIYIVFWIGKSVISEPQTQVLKQNPKMT